jgi:hypothetical protein
VDDFDKRGLLDCVSVGEELCVLLTDLDVCDSLSETAVVVDCEGEIVWEVLLCVDGDSDGDQRGEPEADLESVSLSERGML